MRDQMTMEDIASFIISDARAIKAILQDMLDYTEPYHLHGLQVIADHQIDCCKELQTVLIKDNVE